MSGITAPGLDKVTATYSAANDIHRLEQQSRMVERYDTDGFRQPKAFMPEEDLKVLGMDSALRPFLTHKLIPIIKDADPSVT